jgi:dihydrofolate reductase
VAKLVYTAIMSLDGFMEDAEGSFDWAVPDEEVHQFVNELEASIGTHLYGRRMYETMAMWQTIDDKPDVHEVERAYAEVWRALAKVVYSRTLESVVTPRTTLHRSFDPAVVAEMKSTTDHDISISGADLAGHAFRAGLVDEIHLFWFPVIVGAGKVGIPAGVQAELELLDHRKFGNGVLYAHHRIR